MTRMTRVKRQPMITRGETRVDIRIADRNDARTRLRVSLSPFLSSWQEDLLKNLRTAPETTTADFSGDFADAP